MKTTHTLYLAFIVLVFSSCSRNRFLTSDYAKYAQSHERIAILPYQISMMGRVAQQMPPEEREQLILLKSELFQQDLYGEVLRRSGLDRDDVNISVQELGYTNRLLREAGINALNIGKYSAAELGELLQVDAVVRTRLIKDVFLTRGESLVAGIATDLLSESIPLPLGTRRLTRASEIDIHSKIVDVDAGTAVWSIHTDCDLQWNVDTEDAVQSINNRISRNFPYRN